MQTSHSNATHPAGNYAHRMEGLIVAVQELSLVRSLEDIMAIALRVARELSSSDGATFVLRDGDNCHYAGEDAITPLWKGQRFPMRICLSGWVMKQREPAIIADILGDECIPHEVYRTTFVRSLVIVPIRTLDPIGAIGTYWAQPRTPSAEEVKLLQVLADVTAAALQHAQVYAELEQRIRTRSAELEAAGGASHDEIAERRHAEDDLQEVNEDLRASLERMQQLDKIVRMCAWTNRIELDGEWLTIESYLWRRFGIQVSHGISDEALKALEADLLEP